MKALKLLSALALSLTLSLLLISFASAIVVYGDFTDSTQTAAISSGESISFNVDFFSMNPPMTMKVGLYDSAGNLVKSFLDSSSSSKTYYTTYTYTPSSAGSYKIKVIGTDKINTDSEFLTLTVTGIIPVNHAPVITSTPVTSVNEGATYSYDVQATDPDGDTLIYSLPLAPSWLSINPFTGLISGLAPEVSSNTDYDIVVGVSDSINPIVTQSYTLTVINVPVPPINHAPVITSTPVTSIVEGNVYNYDVQATDSDGDHLTYSLTEAPDWLTINPNSGLITGTAPEVSSNTDYDITVEVSDGRGGIDTQSYTLTVKNYVCGKICEEEHEGTKVLSEPDIYYPNKYFDQFNQDSNASASTDTSGIASTPTSQTTNAGLNIPTFFYVLIAFISLGIVIVVFLIGRNLRR